MADAVAGSPADCEPTGRAPCAAPGAAGGNTVQGRTRVPGATQDARWPASAKYDGNVDVIDIRYPQGDGPPALARRSVPIHSPDARESVQVTL
jgi:hypothetical protein